MRVPAALFLALLVTGCATPRIVPAPAPVAAPLPRPTPPPLAADWRDWPVTAGTWTYTHDARGSVAMFGQAGAAALVILRCDRSGGRMFLSVGGANGTAMTVRTSSVARTLPVGGTGGDPAYLAATLAPADPLLDAMAFSRGRFAISPTTAPPLVLPAWAEVGRVVEDCRG